LLATWLLPKLVCGELKPESKNFPSTVTFTASVDEMEHSIKRPYSGLNLLVNPNQFGVRLPLFELVGGPGKSSVLCEGTARRITGLID
jgi:hypothetical protein